jgi:hypothetical protein
MTRVVVRGSSLGSMDLEELLDLDKDGERLLCCKK